MAWLLRCGAMRSSRSYTCSQFLKLDADESGERPGASVFMLGYSSVNSHLGSNVARIDTGGASSVARVCLMSGRAPKTSLFLDPITGILASS